MGSNEEPRGVWDSGWSISALVAAAVAVPIVIAPLLAPEVRRATEIAGLSMVVTYAAVLFADLLIYLYWRMTGGPANWLVLAITAHSVQSLALAGFVAADPDESKSHAGWILLVQIFFALGVFALVAAAQRHRLRVDPILAGVTLGVVVAVVRDQLVAHTEPLVLSSSTLLLLDALVLLIDLAIAVALFRLTIAPAWARIRLGFAMVLLSFGHAAAYPAPRGVALSTVIVSTNVLAATVLLSLAIRLVRLSWLDNRSALELLGRRLEQIEAAARVEAARLHEIRATVAGLGTASRLIHQRSAVSGRRRREIEDMMDSEMARLQRLLNDESLGAPEPVDIDATIHPIVTRHRALGYPIRWMPSGERAIARADDVAEVVNVLLQNAVNHAPGAGASIVTSKTGGIVEIAISDSGPGVERAIRSKLFEWGEHGRHSGGSGIGLNVARQLTMDLGGYLRLVESSGPGATFVLGLPSEEMS
jgi:signal transduction histidine kinase